MTASRVQRLIFALLVAFMLNALTAAGSAWAATYYVATNGSDSNPGTDTAPFRTIEYAVNRMQAGDTTYVRGGTYNERTISFSRSGTASAPIRLLNAPGAFPVIDFGMIQGDKEPIKSFGVPRINIFNSAGSSTPIGWITIEGFEIRRGWNGIKFANLHDSVIRRNWIHDNLTSGILGNGAHNLIIDRNRLNHNGAFVLCAAGEPCNLDHAIYVDGHSVVVTNNLMYDNLSFGMQLNANKPSSNWVIANNVFAYNNHRSGLVIWGTAPNVRIENNIFYENCNVRADHCYNANGIAMGEGNRGVSIKNNLFYATSPGATLPWRKERIEGVHLVQSGNIINTIAPAFVNPTGGDFHLQPNSPAIDKGLSLSEVTWDHDGGKRPFGPSFDIGAYEFGAPPDSGSPPPNPTGGVPPAVARPPSTYNPGASLCP